MTRWTSRTISFPAFALALILAARPETAAATDCRRSGSEIVCKAEGFDLLIRELLEARAASSQCQVTLEARGAELAAKETELNACRAAGAVPVAPVTPAGVAWKPIVALALGVAGTAGAALALATDAPTGARIALGVGGAAALAGGVVVSLP